MEATVSEAMQYNQELLDVLLRRRADDERRGDLYQRLRALHDAQRREVEQETARVQVELRAVRERLSLAERDAAASARERHKAACPFRPAASPDERLRSTLQQTHTLNRTLRAEVAASTAACDRLQEAVTAHTLRNAAMTTALQQLARAAGLPREVDASAHVETPTAPQLHAAALLARTSADFHAEAFSRLSVGLTAYIAEQDNAARRVRLGGAVLPALLPDLSAAVRNFLASYRQMRGEQRTTHNAALVALAGLDANAL